MLFFLSCVCQDGFAYSHKLHQDTCKVRKGDLPPIAQTRQVVTTAAELERAKGSI